MKSVRRFLDRTLGRWLRHFVFLLVRSYFALFFNISCANKHLLQDLPGGLLLATHVSRHDGPMIAAMLYSTRRVRPAVHHKEYYNWLQFVPMLISNAIPLSSPKTWPAERRAARRERALQVMKRVIGNGGLLLLFPAGHVRRQAEEIIAPHYSGAFEILQAIPDCPVALIRTEGLSKFEEPRYDRFFTFIGRKKGRRHVNVRIEIVTDLKTDGSVEAFNADLERRLNADADWPLRDGTTRKS